MRTSAKLSLPAVVMAFSISTPLEVSGIEQMASPIKVTDLRCESQKEPLNIDTAAPRVSWRMESDERGQKQTAYRILVSSSASLLAEGEADLWDSGKVDLNQSIHVIYGGQPLDSLEQCFWKIRVWDQDGRRSDWSPASSWRMGLLRSSDWAAQWIDPPEAAFNQAVVVSSAVYQTLDGKIKEDVTDIVEELVRKRDQIVVQPGSLGGDPAPGVVKELVVSYSIDGIESTAIAKDFETLRFTSDPGKPAHLFRTEFEVSGAPEGAVVTIHSPGYFELYVNGSKVGKDVLTPAVSNLDHRTFTVAYDVLPLLQKGRNCLGLWIGEGWADGLDFRAQLNLTVDGKETVIATNESWKTRPSNRSKIGGREWGDFGGERVDARVDIEGWSSAGYDDGDWAFSAAGKAPAGSPVSHPIPLNRIGKKIPAKSVTSLGGDRYEIDFGTALTGWLRMTMPQMKSGTTVRMSFADVRRGDQYQHFNQISEFVSGGQAGEVFENKFNYAGFRYVVIEGMPTTPRAEDATALLVESDLEPAGSFECSNEFFNQIHDLNQWTLRCLNLGGYFVDCPHRERMGYGDGQVAVEGFMTSFRADRFYEKWTADWRLRQGPEGEMPHMAPFGSGGGGPGWPGLLGAIVWRHYLYYGDKQILEDNYQTVKNYAAWLETQCEDDVLRKYGEKWDFIGDWVPPRRGMDTDDWPSDRAAELFNNCYRVYQWELLAKMADALGKSGDAALSRMKLASIRPAIHKAFFDESSKMYVIDEQAYYVMPLMTGVAPESERAGLLKKLEQNILEKNDGHLDTGMLGTYFMMEYLREIGRNDLVFTMFNKNTYPSWGHMLAEGATTIWEQWNGYWSNIHACFTSADNWFYQGLAGITPDLEAPGFKHFNIKPILAGDLTWVESHHDSPYGQIRSSWKKIGNELTLEVTVPVNSTATVTFPGMLPREGGKPLDQADGISSFQRTASGHNVVELKSGAYRFTSKL